MLELESLIKSGVIEPDVVIVWNRRGLKVSHKATIRADGKIVTEDGAIHRTPSGAAKHLNNGRSVDGWLAWRILDSQKTLSQFRKLKS